MIKYEVYIIGNDEIIEEFESPYPYQEGRRIFLNVNGLEVSLLISSVTHNHLRDTPYVRLNCNPRKYGKLVNSGNAI